MSGSLPRGSVPAPMGVLFPQQINDEVTSSRHKSRKNMYMYIHLIILNLIPFIYELRLKLERHTGSPQSSLPFCDLLYLNSLGWHTADSAPKKSKETQNALCIWPHNTKPSENASYPSEASVSLPTLGGYNTASGIITLDPFPVEKKTSFMRLDAITWLAGPQLNTHRLTCTCVWCKLEPRYSGWWECLRIYTPWRCSYIDRWCGKHELRHTHIDYHTH